MFCLRKDTYSKPKQNCFISWIEHCLHYSYLSHQWRHSTRHWEILDEEGTLLKSICQKLTFNQSKRLYHSRSRFSKKLMVSVRVSKTNIFFYWFICRKKRWPELLHWSVEDFLTAWMSSTLSGQWLWIPARQCSVTPHKSDATVSATEHSRLHSCWWMGVIFSRS